MADFIDKDAFLKDVLPECEYPVKLMAAVERQPIVHIDDMTFKIQNELQAANPSGVIEITFVKHGRWIPTEYDGYADGKPVYDAFECSECGHEHKGEEDTLTAFCPDCGAKMGATDTNVLTKSEPPEEVQDDDER